MKDVRVTIVETNAKVAVSTEDEGAKRPLLIGVTPRHSAQILGENVLATSNDAIPHITGLCIQENESKEERQEIWKRV